MNAQSTENVAKVLDGSLPNTPRWDRKRDSAKLRQRRQEKAAAKGNRQLGSSAELGELSFSLSLSVCGACRHLHSACTAYAAAAMLSQRAV